MQISFSNHRSKDYRWCDIRVANIKLHYLNYVAEIIAAHFARSDFVATRRIEMSIKWC